MSNSKKGNRYSEDFIRQLYELSLNGKSVPTLASEYGIPTGTIYKWFSELKPIAHTRMAHRSIRKKWTRCVKESVS